MRILLLNLPPHSAETVKVALSGQGFEVLQEHTLDVERVEGLQVEVAVTEASPADLTCCGLIVQLKAREATKSIRILILVEGGALERARALDLGADDVMSSPFEPAEFAARIRAQVRDRAPAEELRAKLREVEQREHLAEIAVETLSGGVVSKKRAWVLPAILALCVLTLAATFITSFSYRKTRKETLQLKSEIARLNSGILQQGDLLRRAEQARLALNASADSAARATLQAQSDELKRKMAASGGDADLRRQLAETQNRLNRIESDGKVAETIVKTYGSSVCLLHVVVEFLDRSTGKPLLIAVDQLGKPLLDDKGNVQLELDGNGPHLQLDVFGTGFLVRKDGRLLTNHHVAEPWWGGPTAVMTTLFPSVILQQQVNSVSTRHIQPRGPDAFDFVWTHFGFADDTPEMQRRRLRQANLFGPAGYVSADDGEVIEFSQQGARQRPGGVSVVELGGTDTATRTEHTVTETLIRSMYAYWRRTLDV